VKLDNENSMPKKKKKRDLESRVELRALLPLLGGATAHLS
jgi:hypothetical protein